MPSARQIELFHAVMVHGGVTRAASVLQIAQPGISRAMTMLADELGFQLFTRMHGRLVPTPEAEAFHREVERSFVGLDRLRTVAQDIRNFGTGRLRICCLTALSKGVIAKVLSRFVERYPKVTVSLQVRSTTTVWEWTAAAQCDVGLAGPKTGFVGVTSEPFLSLPALLALPREHPLAARDKLAPSDLADVDFITLGLQDPTRTGLDRAFAGVGVMPRIRIETQYSATVCSLVAAGLGVGLVNPVVAAEHRHLPIVFRKFDSDVTFDSVLLLPRGRPRGQLVDQFVELLTEEAVALRQWAQSQTWLDDRGG